MVRGASKRILFLEDDPVIGAEIIGDLKEQGFATAWAKSLAEAKRLVREEHFDLVLLDVNLPDGNSLDLCRTLRESEPSLPILFLSARADEQSALSGLTAGADDYLRKPFSRRELLLKIRRATGTRKGRISFEGLVLDLDKAEARGPRGNPIEFSSTEFKLLVALASRPGEAISRDELLEKIDDDGEGLSDAITTHTSRIRRKLKDAGIVGIALTSVYGLGYRLERKP